MAAAARLVEAGCYICLRKAESLYGALQERFPSSDAARVGRTTAVLLLAARSRELGLSTGWEAQAEAIVATGGGPPLEAYRRVILQVAPPIRAGTLEELDDLAARAEEARRSLTEGQRAALTLRAHSDPVAAYFAVLLACADRTALPVPAIDALPAAIRSVPLVAYAAGACSASYAGALDEVLEREPRFAEARYHRGIQALGAGALATADTELAAAAAALPEAPAFHLARGHVHLELQEHAEALRAFDRVLVTVPDQREALLGRVRALSHLGRAPDAIAGADRLIELGTWLLGDAYYWRAWNRRQLKQLDAAAEDIQSAKAYLFNADVHKLAGFIAYDRGRFEQARAELALARERDAGDCDVPFALGLVHARLDGPPAAASSFGAAADCAASSQRTIRQRMREIESTNLAADRRTALLARAARALDAAQQHEGLAAINAARMHGRAGNAAEARVFAERAAAWDAHREDAERLLEGLGTETTDGTETTEGTETTGRRSRQ